MDPRCLLTAVPVCLCALVRADFRNVPGQTGGEPPADEAASAEGAFTLDPYESERERSLKQKFIDALPESMSSGLELDFWGWFSYARAIQPDNNDYWDAELSVAVTKSFDQVAVISAQVNFINANDTARAELGNGYFSLRPDDEAGTILTVGKFYADFGIEGRNFWDRRTGTPSLLFGAQPQDIVGVMVTQPIGDTGLNIRPFISADFQGAFYFDQPPSGGVKADYRPSDDFVFKLTNWIGPGLVIRRGEPLNEPYPGGAYGEDSAAYAVASWQGPYLVAEREGTMYFLEAAAEWHPRPDLTLSAEYVLSTTGTQGRRFGWEGWMLMAIFDVTDRFHVYGRWSFLDDGDWFVTGFFQRRQEITFGGGYHILDGLEVRAEYRNETSDSEPHADIVSVHLTFTY